MTHSAENDAPRGLHPCVGCGLELDGDDRRDHCDECVMEES